MPAAQPRRDELVRIRREGHRPHGASGGGKRLDQRPLGDVPDFHRVILAAGGKEFSVRRKCGAGDDPIVAAEGGELITLALAPKITPFEAAQIHFAGLGAQCRQGAAREAEIAPAQYLRPVAHIARVQI